MNLDELVRNLHTKMPMATQEDAIAFAKSLVAELAKQEPVGHVVEWVDGSLIHAWLGEPPPKGTHLSAIAPVIPAEQGKLLNEAIAERDAERNNWVNIIAAYQEQLAACQRERDDYRKALEICKKEMQGDKWDALYIDTVLAKYAHTDHPLRHYDRICPACNTEEKP